MVVPLNTMHFSSIFSLVTSKHQLALTRPVRSVRDLYRRPFIRHEHMLEKAMNMKEQHNDVQHLKTGFDKNRLSWWILCTSTGRMCNSAFEVSSERQGIHTPWSKLVWCPWIPVISGKKSAVLQCSSDVNEGWISLTIELYRCNWEKSMTCKCFIAVIDSWARKIIFWLLASTESLQWQWLEKWSFCLSFDQIWHNVNKTKEARHPAVLFFSLQTHFSAHAF